MTQKSTYDKIALICPDFQGFAIRSVNIVRKEINGIVYDTETATIDKKFTCGAPGDPYGYEETLYITNDGKFFVYTYGGVKSKYPHENIVPIEREDVKNWMLSR